MINFNTNTFKTGITVLIGLTLQFGWSASHAASFCVSNATELRTALVTATVNGQDDEIKIVQGTYVGPFIYSTAEGYRLTLKGGYTTGCAESSRVVAPANTVLDGNNAGPALVFTGTNAADLVVDGLTIQNGNNTQNRQGGGLHINTNGGDVTLSNNIITKNTAQSNGGGVYVTGSDTVTLTNNTLTDNTAGSGSGAYFDSPNSITLTNNLITGNSSNYYPAIDISSSNTATITGNTISDNTASSGIAGISLSSGSVTFSNNTVTGNTGGGIYLQVSNTANFTDNTVSGNKGLGVSFSGTTTLTNNTISNNTGGGIYGSSSATATLTNNTITGNTATRSGGGISLSSYATLTNNTITGNTATGSGGGIFARSSYSSDLTLTNNLIRNNKAGDDGGGINSSVGNVVLVNNVITDNTADGNNHNDGGGVNIYSPDKITLTNNTIYNNTADNGGGISLTLRDDSASADIYNNLIWNNNAPEGSDIYLNNDDDGNYIGSPVKLLNNDFAQGANGFYIKIPVLVDPSNLNNVSPLFVNANAGNYRLQSGSPAVDAGHNHATEIATTDKDNNPRVMNGVVDIGAYEYQWQSADISVLQLSAANYNVNENGGSVTINVTRGGGSNKSVSVNYTTVDGTAKAGTDYTAASGTLNWAAGDMAAKTFTVKIINDNVADGDKTLNLQLKNATAGSAIIGSNSTSVLTIKDSGKQCNYTITPLSRTHNANAGNNTVAVTASTGCPWTATSNNTGWLKMTSGNSGNGNGTVSYSVTKQTSPQSRTGTLTIAGKTFTVIQIGINCSYTVEPTTRSHSANTENETINVTALSGCAWTAASTAAWIQITSDNNTGQGNGTIKYTVTANTSTEDRQGTITVANNKTVTLTQKGLDCSFSIAPTSRSHSAESETGEVVVTAPRGCPWTASSNVSWANITVSGSGQGQSAVTYAVMANTHSQSRQGTLTIAGQPVTLNQAAFINPVTSTRLINLSTRAPVEGGLGDIIAGFIITGSGSEKIWLRGFGIEAGVDPKLLVQKFPSGEVVTENDNWADDPRAGEVSALPDHLQLTNTTDAGLLLDLPAGAYTVTLSSVSTTGLGLIGVDEVEQSSTAKLTNLSTRAPIRGGAYDIIAGLIITGTGKQKVWLRGFGIDAGVDPKILVQSFPDAAEIASNNNWQTNSNANDIAALPAHLQLTKTTDAGLLLELPAGAYTVTLSSVGAKGLGLIGVDAVE